jgi:hypothetical protein
MERLYLVPIGDPTQYLESGFYPENYEPPVGYALVNQLPLGAVQRSRKGLLERLNVIFLQQPLSTRIGFYTLKAAVISALADQDIEAAQGIIASVTLAEALEPVRQQLLEEFNHGA